MKRLEELGTFAKFGVGLATFLGAYTGIVIGFACGIRLTPTVALLFPGALVGMIVARVFGTAAGLLACCAGNAGAYGFAMYGWFRLAAALRRRIPEWFGALGRSLAQRGIRW